jgi:Bacterial Ig-like domain (group 3)
MQRSGLCKLLVVGSLGTLAAIPAAIGFGSVAGADGSPIAVSATFGDGSVGASYSGGAISATGGSGTYKFTASGLPPGLHITYGKVSGKPTTAGDYSVTVTATDNSKPTKLTGSTTATFEVDPGQPTMTLKAPKVAVGANVTLTATLRGIAKGQPDTGTVSFASGGSPITCATTTTAGNKTECTFDSSILGGVGKYSVQVNDSGDVNYDAASAAGQVSVYK